MVGLMVILTHAPFGHENAFAGLYTALAAQTKNVESIVILRMDGVYAGLKGQEDPMAKIHLPSTEDVVNDFVGLDGKVYAESESLSNRAIKVGDLIEGVVELDAIAIEKLILDQGERIVVF